VEVPRAPRTLDEGAKAVAVEDGHLHGVLEILMQMRMAKSGDASDPCTAATVLPDGAARRFEILNRRSPAELLRYACVAVGYLPARAMA
jgi:hypothetical protein